MDKKPEMQTIEKGELLQEIIICLKDYFLCDIAAENNGINLSFNNGQKFRLNLSEN